VSLGISNIFSLHKINLVGTNCEIPDGPHDQKANSNQPEQRYVPTKI